MNILNKLKATLLLAGIGLLPQMLLAVDGVQEINQTCTTQLGCFSGDSAGFPVTINGSAGKSYRLTSDLIVPADGSLGIIITSNNVSIDLNGFALIGFNCVGATEACTPQDPMVFGDGIFSTLNFFGTSVKNGSVVGMNFRGINLGHQATVEGVEVRWNRFIGIQVGDESRLMNNIAIENGESGIFAREGSYISQNIVSRNATIGIDTSAFSHISGNTVHSNGTDGIVAGSGSSIFQNTTRSNQGNGITAGSGSRVDDNTVYVNQGYGIEVVGAGTVVQGNAIRASGLFGLRITGAGTYSNNTITGGSTVMGGTPGSHNFCTNNFTCP